MSRQVWKGSTLLNPEPPVLVSCGAPEKPNLITVGWTGTICTQPPMLSISVRPERYSHHLIQESGEFVVNLPTESLVTDKPDPAADAANAAAMAAQAGGGMY